MLNPYTLFFRSKEIERSYQEKKSINFSYILIRQMILLLLIILGSLIYRGIIHDLYYERIIRYSFFLSVYFLCILTTYKKIIPISYISLILNITTTIYVAWIISDLATSNDNNNKLINCFIISYSFSLFQNTYYQGPAWSITFFSIIFNVIYYMIFLHLFRSSIILILIFFGVNAITIFSSYFIEKGNRIIYYEEFQNSQIHEHYKHLILELSSNIKILMKKNENNMKFIDENPNNSQYFCENYIINLINNLGKNQYELTDAKTIKIFLEGIEIENRERLEENYEKLKIYFPEDLNNENILSLKNLNEYTNFFIGKNFQFFDGKPLIFNQEAHEKNNEKHKFKIYISFYTWKKEIYLLMSISDFYLEEKVKELVELDQIKDQILANVTHDLRTPLNGMLFLINESKKIDKKELENTLNMAEIQGKLLMNLINDILDYSRIRNNNLRLNISEFDLKKTLQEVFILFEHKAKLSDIKLKILVPKENIILRNDEIRLKQILINLIGNAIKFTLKGFVKLCVELKSPYIYFEIIDTGVGIEESQIKQLFHPFISFNQNGLNQNGIGLGLLISRNLIAKLGKSEEIIINSTLGKGSKFSFKILKRIDLEEKDNYDEENDMLRMVNNFNERDSNSIENIIYDESLYEKEKITIPSTEIKTMDSLYKIREKMNIKSDCSLKLDKDQNTKNVELTSIKNQIKKIVEKNSKKLSILLVDDNYLNILALQNYLKNLEIEKHINLETAFNGKTAFDKFSLKNKESSEKPFHLIILDCEMPIMDGFQCSEAICSLIEKENYQKCEIVGYSANKEDIEIKRCLNAGMSNFLEKPCSITRFYQFFLDWIQKF